MTRGRPADVLLYIDYCLDEHKPCVVDLGGGRAAARRALPSAVAAYRASCVRASRAQQEHESWRHLVAAMELTA